jgi:alpha,alpha-trehalase
MSATPAKRASRQASEDGRREAAVAQSGEMPQSAAALSPFTPIGNYGFLSNCHTRVRWWSRMARSTGCAFRALTRPACLGRCSTAARAAFGSARSGSMSRATGSTSRTNSLVTSWKTSTGWAVVRVALTMGPRRGKNTVTPHTRPPADEDADHGLVRTARCIGGMVEIDLVCEPAFDYGRVTGDWRLSEDEHRAEAPGAGSDHSAAD